MVYWWRTAGGVCIHPPAAAPSRREVRHEIRRRRSHCRRCHPQRCARYPRESVTFNNVLNFGRIEDPQNETRSTTFTGAYTANYLTISGSLTRISQNTYFTEASVLVTPPVGTPFIIQPFKTAQNAVAGGPNVTAASTPAGSYTIPVTPIPAAGVWTFRFFERFNDIDGADSRWDNVTITLNDGAPPAPRPSAPSATPSPMSPPMGSLARPRSTSHSPRPPVSPPSASASAPRAPACSLLPPTTPPSARSTPSASVSRLPAAARQPQTPSSFRSTDRLPISRKSSLRSARPSPQMPDRGASRPSSAPPASERSCTRSPSRWFPQTRPPPPTSERSSRTRSSTARPP
ncbi:MAG: hypothetical protein QM783_01340 [Phycisphaerales bacterium]